MHLRLLPEKANPIQEVKENGTKESDKRFQSPYGANISGQCSGHKNLCRDIFGKHEPGYIFSDSYDFVQSVALFLCDHFGEYLDDVLYISKRGKPRTIKIECYRIVTRMLARGHRAYCRCQCFEFTKEEPELVYEYQTDEGQDFSRADEIAASLNLTENMSLALDYRMSGLSYPEIAKQLSRAVSTVYEYFEKMRARYSAIYG